MKIWAKSILKAFLSISVVTLVLLVVLFYGLKKFTHHGDEIFVPDFTEMTVEEAKMTAHNQHLRLVIIDSVFQKGKEKVTIIEQKEDVGSRVKENRRIHVIINSLTPEIVKMPSVISISLREARSVLRNKGLKVRRLIYISDIAAHYVLAQKYNGRDIAKDTELEKDSKIDLVVGSGTSSKLTNIPDLLKQNVNTSRERLTDQYLNLGKIFYDESIQNDHDKRYAKVWRQYPVPDTTAKFGSPVDVWLTIDNSLLNDKNN